VKVHQRHMIPLDSRIARWAPVPRASSSAMASWHTVSPSWPSPEAFPAILHALGVPAPHFLAWARHTDEVLGGLAVILGAFVALVALPMAALLVVAILPCICLTGSAPSSSCPDRGRRAVRGRPGYELNLLYLACLAALVLGGSGPLAIDGLVRRRGTAGQS